MVRHDRRARDPGIARYPAALLAVDPAYIVRFFAHHGLAGIAIFGAVVLCVSGVEALYADMSHFGRGPIALAWSPSRFPALALNYAGPRRDRLVRPVELCRILSTARPAGGVFYVVVAIATAATIIASQALISGVFTLTKQAINLGFIPRSAWSIRRSCTAARSTCRCVNRILAIACIALVVGFHTLDAAGQCVRTGGRRHDGRHVVAYYDVVRIEARLESATGGAATAPFLAIEAYSSSESLPKVPEGGWIPLMISLVVFVIASTWRTGRRRIGQSQVEQSTPVDHFFARCGAGWAFRFKARPSSSRPIRRACRSSFATIGRERTALTSGSFSSRSCPRTNPT